MILHDFDGGGGEVKINGGGGERVKYFFNKQRGLEL